MICSGRWRAVTVSRSRADPFATVGCRIAGAKKPFRASHPE